MTAKITVALVVSFMATLAVPKVLFRDYLGLIFTTDVAVVEQVSRLAVIAALFQVSDGLQAATSGVMRGMGKQKLVAATNFVGFWVVGLTLGASLAFGAHVGVAGLWWGLAGGLTFTAIILVTVLLRTDWEAEVRSAQHNLGMARTTSSTENILTEAFLR